MVHWHNPQLLPCFSFANSFTYRKNFNLLLFFIVFLVDLCCGVSTAFVLIFFCNFLPLCILLQFVKLDQHSKHQLALINACMCECTLLPLRAVTVLLLLPIHVLGTLKHCSCSNCCQLVGSTQYAHKTVLDHWQSERVNNIIITLLSTNVVLLRKRSY